MSFLTPKVEKPQVATPATQADASTSEGGTSPTAPPSLISTGSQGLKRKATTIKTSLIGGQ